MHLDQAGHDNSGFIKFWEGIARHYKGKSETRLVFELLNEPQFLKNPEVWYALQRKTVGAIRAIDPLRTIMVTSTSWSGIDTLASMTPLPDSNLLYTYHCYDPFLFTHQGASWVGNPPQDLRHMPFPSSPEAVQAILAEQPTSERNTVKSYGQQGYDKAYLKSRIAKAEDWAVANHVPGPISASLAPTRSCLLRSLGPGGLRRCGAFSTNCAFQMPFGATTTHLVWVARCERIERSSST